jgi:hypothetical protein
MWAHAVNNRAKLIQALNDPKIVRLEVDVRNNMSGPYLAHDAGLSDLTLKAFLDHVKKCPRKIGIKLDFKEPKALMTSLEMTRDWPGEIFYNADILVGPAGMLTAFKADSFIKTCLMFGCQNAILSLGWTVGVPLTLTGIGYTNDMVDEMLGWCEYFNLKKVTFAMHTVHALASPQAVAKLLAANENYTITYWGVVDREMLRDLNQRDPSRVMVDVNLSKDALELFRLSVLRTSNVIKLNEPVILFRH